jgi:membrane protein YdbS with pleckstrin-like domain
MSDSEDDGDGHSDAESGSGPPDAVDEERERGRSGGGRPGTASETGSVSADPEAGGTADHREAGSASADRDAEATAGEPDAGATADHREAGATAGKPEAGAAVLDEEELGVSRELDGRVRVRWLVGPVIGSVVVATLLAGVLPPVARRVGVDFGFVPGGRAGIFASVVVVCLGLAFLWVLRYYRTWRYEVRDDSLYLTRGVVTRVQTIVPYVRVQHVDTRRSPVERLLGLSSLVVYTAGSRGADVTIPGLTDDRAADLQRRLKALAIASEEEDAV